MAPASPRSEIRGRLRCRGGSAAGIKADLSARRTRTRQNLKPLNFQAQNSSEAFINSPFLCTFGLMGECQAKERQRCSLLHERAAQFSINLTSHAPSSHHFDKKKIGGRETSWHRCSVISQVDGSRPQNGARHGSSSAREHVRRGSLGQLMEKRCLKWR